MYCLLRIVTTRARTRSRAYQHERYGSVPVVLYISTSGRTAGFLWQENKRNKGRASAEVNLVALMQLPAAFSCQIRTDTTDNLFASPDTGRSLP